MKVYEWTCFFASAFGSGNAVRVGKRKRGFLHYTGAKNAPAPVEMTDLLWRKRSRKRSCRDVFLAAHAHGLLAAHAHGEEVADDPGQQSERDGEEQEHAEHERAEKEPVAGGVALALYGGGWQA